MCISPGERAEQKQRKPKQNEIKSFSRIDESTCKFVVLIVLELYRIIRNDKACLIILDLIYIIRSKDSKTSLFLCE